jgi:ATP-dependent Lon protease
MCRFASAEDKTYKRFLESVKTILAENEPSVMNEYYLVSRAVNEHFTGRKDIRQRLIDCLTPGRHPRSRKQRRFVLHGMGGSGKTQISLKFADECRKKYVPCIQFS